MRLGLVLLGAVCLACSPAGPRILFQQQSELAYVTVVDEGSQRCLFFGAGADERETCIERAIPDHSVFEYTAMMFVGFLFHPQTTRMLMIGIGGGYMPGVIHRHLPQVVLDAVDVDPVVVDVARRFFGLPEDERLKIHIVDGRRFVEAGTARYHQVWLDAFDDQYVPPALSTREFLVAVKRRLLPGGVFVENLHRSHPRFRAQMATAQAVFERIWVFYGDNSDNAVLVAGDLPEAGLAQLLNRAEQAGGSIGDIDLAVQAGRLSPGATAVGAELLTDESFR